MEEAGHGRVATIRHIVEIVAIVAAGIWAFYTFIYEERIKPAHEPLESIETVTMHREGRIRDLDIIRVRVTIQNVGKTQFDTVATSLNVVGYRYATARRSAKSGDRQYLSEDIAQKRQPHTVFSEVLLYAAAANGPANYHNIVDPGSTTGASYVLAIPHGRYDVLHAVFQYWPHKTPLPRRYPVEMHLGGDGSYVVKVSPDVLEDNVESELALTQ